MTGKEATSYVPLPKSFEENDNWISYEDRIIQHFEAYKVTDDNQKRALLLASLSESVSETLSDLCFPEKAATKTFKDICATLKLHFTPVVAVYGERRKFYETKQQAGDSVNEFVARLKHASRHCKFEKDYAQILRDAFVCGLREGPVRSKVFAMTPTATLEECLKVAITTEAIKAIDTSDFES